MQSSLACAHGVKKTLTLTPNTKTLTTTIPPRIISHLKLKNPQNHNFLITQIKPNQTQLISYRKTPTKLHCGISSNDQNSENERSVRKWIEVVGEAVSTAFPIWVTLACLLGLVKPSSFNWVTPKWSIIGLTLTMLGMGMTLTLDDLSSAFAMPKEVFSGFLLQYSVCTHLFYFIAVFFNDGFCILGFVIEA